MSTSVLPRPAESTPPIHQWARLGLFTELESPSQVVENVTPNWFAAVMGTGIVSVAASSLPWRPYGLHELAIAFWALAAGLLIVLTLLTIAHWWRHPATARSHASDPVMVNFYGAPAMALLTVGAATLLVGKSVVGPAAAVTLDTGLWTAGTLFGLATAAFVPYRLFGCQRAQVSDAFGGWLMPMVPPMVSASTGALLVPHAPLGQVRVALFYGCYALFGLALIPSLIIITLIWLRLMIGPVGEARMVPTLWIVLGPLGQSITAANLLGGVAHDALPAPAATVLKTVGIVYGVPIWGFALLWTAIATATTARTALEHLPFSLTWWSFTFPVGTVVTGTSALTLATGSDLFRGPAVVLYVALLAAWTIVAARTARASARGGLFLLPGSIRTD